MLNDGHRAARISGRQRVAGFSFRPVYVLFSYRVYQFGFAHVGLDEHGNSAFMETSVEARRVFSFASFSRIEVRLGRLLAIP
jgi:hypothetical protein